MKKPFLRRLGRLTQQATQSDLQAMCSNPQFRNRELGFIVLLPYYYPFHPRIISSSHQLLRRLIRVTQQPDASYIVSVVCFGHLSTGEAVLIGERLLSRTDQVGNDTSGNLNKNRKKHTRAENKGGCLVARLALSTNILTPRHLFYSTHGIHVAYTHSHTPAHTLAHSEHTQHLHLRASHRCVSQQPN